MIHTDEDDEFERIERENAMKGQPYHFKKREWVGLTDQEIRQMGLNNYMRVVRETEAKLKEKNEKT
jgi:hypothetical protein